MGSENTCLGFGSVFQFVNDNRNLRCGCWQHSGLNVANPGDVVYMEGGETLVQWRKSFFAQYGVSKSRMPLCSWILMCLQSGVPLTRSCLGRVLAPKGW